MAEGRDGRQHIAVGQTKVATEPAHKAQFEAEIARLPAPAEPSPECFAKLRLPGESPFTPCDRWAEMSGGPMGTIKRGRRTPRGRCAVA